MQLGFAWSAVADTVERGIVIAAATLAFRYIRNQIKQVATESFVKKALDATKKDLNAQMQGLASKEFVSAEITRNNGVLLRDMNGTYLRSELHREFARGMNDRVDAVDKRVDDIHRRIA